MICDEPWQINVSELNDFTNAKVFCFNCNFTGITEITVGGDHFEEPGMHSTTVIDWSNEPRSKLIVVHNITVHTSIAAFNVSTLPLTAVRNETVLELVAWLLGGTDVVVSAYWNGDTVSSMSFSTVADILVIAFYHTYQTTGTFVVSGLAQNLLGRIYMENQTVAVYERIHDLILYGNNSLVTPPGDGTWVVATGSGQLPLENVECVWTMGTNYVDTMYNVALLDTATDHRVSFTYGSVCVSRQTVTSTCSNPVSCQVLTMDVYFFVDTDTMSCIDLVIPDAFDCT